MIYARQSTAISVTVGPVLDADGVAVTGGVVGDFKIAKNGGAPAALNGSATLTHRHTGFYSLSLTTSDVATVGTVEITIDDTVNACPMKEIQVIEEAVYDALYAASANGFAGSAGSSTVTFSNTSIATVTTATNVTTVNGLAANVITAASIAADAITDAKVAADVTIASVTGSVGSVTGAVGSVTGAVGSVTGNVGGSVVGTVASVVGAVGSVTGNVGGNVTGSVGSVASGGITSGSFAAGAIDNAAIATDAIGSAELAASAVTEIQSGLATAAALSTVDGKIDTIDNFLDTEIAAILADTNELQTDWANGGRLDLILDARASQSSVDTIDGIVDSILVDTAEIGAAGAGLTALATQASVNAIDAIVDDILVDTGTTLPATLTTIAGYIDTEIGTLITNLATVDTVVDAIKVTTDKLDDTLEDDAGTYRFTANALEEAPTGGGGGSAPTVEEIADEVQTRTIARVTLVDTTTTNTDMRGTNNAALAATALSTAVWTAPPTGFLTATFPATVSSYAGGAVASVTGTVGGIAGTLNTLDALDTAQDSQHATTQGAVATNATNISTILARIGAFTGSGVNTVLGFFKAIFRSDATTPSDIGGTFDPATDSLEATATATTTPYATLARVATTLEADGLVYRFTENALEQAPAGGGSGGDTKEDVWAYIYSGDTVTQQAKLQAVYSYVMTSPPAITVDGTDAQNLNDAFSYLIAAYKSACYSPQPNYSIGGQSVSYADYLRMLVESIKITTELRAMLDPYFIVSNIG